MGTTVVKRTNKFINSTDNVVDDSIRGLILSHDNLATLDYCHRMMLRADIDKLKRGKQVTLLAGGGSGHEPFAAGFVGKGLLSAAVCGNIFASPPASHILAAETAVFVVNYTGDRLNFGLAVERFNTSREKEMADAKVSRYLYVSKFLRRMHVQDGEAEMVMIGDDVALESNTAGRDVGRRGLAGAVLLLKIVGAMAEEGKNLKAITSTSRTVNDNLGSIGVSLSACGLPGRGPMFELETDRMEFGLGIHGEPGFERSQYRTAKEVAKLLLEKLENSQKLNLQKGEKVVVLLNNLGGTSQLELNILSGEIHSWLHENGYCIQRFYAESVMTSLNGHGISIYLDAVTEAPAWRMTHLPPKLSSSANEIKSGEIYDLSLVDCLFRLQDTKHLEAAIKKACIAIHESVDILNGLDGSAGDGDCGTTLKIGAAKILKCLDEGKLRCDIPQSLFKEISQIFEDDVGATAGAVSFLWDLFKKNLSAEKKIILWKQKLVSTVYVYINDYVRLSFYLYALMFSSAAQAFIESTTAKEWYIALKNGLETIMKYGQAKPGSRSMVDPLHAAVTAISCDNPEKAQWENAVKVKLDFILYQAEERAKATSGMFAQVGRATYTSALVQKEPDAGAVAVSIWLRAVYEAVYS
uniref:Triokinase/FMN cyclase n=1 Tax=Elaeophora elaphi TaxID=1147741 RepID=A0A0R3S0A5_9BILA